MNDLRRSKLKEVLTLAEDNLRCLSERPLNMQRRNSNLRKMDEILQELGLSNVDMSQLYNMLNDANETQS